MKEVVAAAVSKKRSRKWSATDSNDASGTQASFAFRRKGVSVSAPVLSRLYDEVIFSIPAFFKERSTCKLYVTISVLSLLGLCNGWSFNNIQLQFPRWKPQLTPDVGIRRSNRRGRTIENIHPSRRRISTLQSTETDTGADISRQQIDQVLSDDSFWVNQSSLATLGYEGGDEDIPHPTENGGYSHTKASRAKISAANKGKTPWNKGLHRSEDVKAKIALGVRAKNRERFLEKLRAMGVTEEEYEENKQKERREKDAERRARRTEKGGYRLTDETKRKISDILKQKHAAGEIKPRTIKPENVRRGFSHSEETRRKISESLRKRWATDPEYRAKMVQISNAVNTLESVRQKISTSLQAKWRDDSFRETMLSKIINRKQTEYDYQRDKDRRDKISAAMKAKWQDEEYRKKATESMTKRKAEISMLQPKQPIPPKPRVRSANPLRKQEPQLVLPRTETSPSTQSPEDEEIQFRVVTPRSEPHAKVNTKVAKKNTAKKVKEEREQNNEIHKSGGKIFTGDSDSGELTFLNDHSVHSEPMDIQNVKSSGKKETPPSLNGSVDLLKEERRDLYDLLYSDEDDDDDDDDMPSTSKKNNNRQRMGGGDQQSRKKPVFGLNDENLDDFDPYGLEDN